MHAIWDILALTDDPREESYDIVKDRNFVEVHKTLIEFWGAEIQNHLRKLQVLELSF